MNDCICGQGGNVSPILQILSEASPLRGHGKPENVDGNLEFLLRWKILPHSININVRGTADGVRVEEELVQRLKSMIFLGISEEPAASFFAHFEDAFAPCQCPQLA